ncbi:hypothetical protein WCLP8_2000003 [uncultured Gammaproteobacteria bacterium]
MVDELRIHEERGELCDTSLVSRLRIGQTVRLIHGAFGDMVGRFQSMSDAERVIVLMEIMGREIRVRVPVGAVGPAAGAGKGVTRLTYCLSCEFFTRTAVALVKSRGRTALQRVVADIR